MLDPYYRVWLRGQVTRPYWRFRFHSFGDASIIHRPAWVYRPRQIAIGDRVLILHQAWLEVGEQTRNPGEPVLRIGNNVLMRSHCTISALESVEIEDDVLIAAFTSIYDSDHTVGGSGNPAGNPHVTAPVRIGRGSWLGERVTVLRGATIGRGCVIGAHSVVNGEIPDHSIAVGAPARVVGSTRPEAVSDLG